MPYHLGAAFIGKFLPGTSVYLPSPTWGNHKNIFADSGVEWKEYKYYDAATIGLDLEGMIADINAAPEGSVFVLHGGEISFTFFFFFVDVLREGVLDKFSSRFVSAPFFLFFLRSFSLLLGRASCVNDECFAMERCAT